MGSSYILLLTNKMAASLRSDSTPGIRVAHTPISRRLDTSAFDARITYRTHKILALAGHPSVSEVWLSTSVDVEQASKGRCRSRPPRGQRQGQLVCHLYERRHRVLELRRAVRGRDLHADARLFLRYHGIRKPNDVAALVEQARGHALREVGVVEHDGTMGCSPARISKPASCMLLRM